MSDRNNKRRIFAMAGLATGLLAGSIGAYAQIACGYEVQIIQAPFCEPFGFPPTRGKGISETGEIVGFYSACVIGPGRAFRWTEETGLVTLEIPDGFTASGAEDIDSATGWIVGALQTPGTDGPFAAVWADGKVFDLGTMPGGDFSNARAIASDPNPIIVGKWGNENVGPIHGFIWEDGVMTNLGDDLGTESSRANDIRGRRVTGWMGSGFLQDGQAYIWDEGRVTGLGPIPKGFFSIGTSINRHSEVAGWGLVEADGFPVGQTRGFLWREGKMIDIPPLPGFLRSSATDLTDATVVIGASTGLGALSAGFIWYQDVMVDVNTLIEGNVSVEVTSCSAINSQGQIAATGHDAKGDVVALLLTPVQARVGDLDHDCNVGAADLLILVTNWGPCRDCDDCPADLNGDCVVGATDLLMLLVNWG